MESRPKAQKTEWELKAEQRQKDVNDSYEKLNMEARRKFNDEQYRKRLQETKQEEENNSTGQLGLGL